MDLDAELEEARQQFMREQEQATYSGQPPSDDRVQGARDGWDAAIAFIKRQAFKKLLGR